MQRRAAAGVAGGGVTNGVTNGHLRLRSLWGWEAGKFRTQPYSAASKAGMVLLVTLQQLMGRCNWGHTKIPGLCNTPWPLPSARGGFTPAHRHPLTPLQLRGLPDGEAQTPFGALPARAQCSPRVHGCAV